MKANPNVVGGGAMSVWDDIDALKRAHELDLAKTRSFLHDTYGKKEANSLRIVEGGLWRCLHERVTYTARTSAGLLEQLPKKATKGR